MSTPPRTHPRSGPPAAAAPSRRRSTAEQRAWYWYDWANSAYVTTTTTVLLGPYLTAIAKQAACPTLPPTAVCRSDLSVLGVPVSPGSLVPYTLTISTIVSALVLIFVGALVDRSPRPTRLFAGFAWTGAVAACLMFLVAGTSWALGVLLLIVANLSLGASLVIYDSLLIRIAGPDDRDRVSSRGWALGYLGGGLLLALNLVLLTVAGRLGLSTTMAVRVSLLSAGLWWGLFTLIPVMGLRHLNRLTDSPTNERVRAGTPVGEPAAGGVVVGSLRQLRATLAELRAYPQTLLFLLAYLFFNDGIQTVIGSSSLYGAEQLLLSSSQLVVVILLVQFVAFGGALLFGRLARSYGAWRVVLSSLGVWAVVVAAAFFLPARRLLPFLILAVFIGVVLGGSQALSRSMYSQLVPSGREAEFFSLYQAMERGTSWFGTLLFGLVQQLTHSYRLAILALVVFFAIGGALLSRVRMREGVLAAGNPLPMVL